MTASVLGPIEEDPWKEGDEAAIEFSGGGGLEEEKDDEGDNQAFVDGLHSRICRCWGGVEGRERVWLMVLLYG